MCTLLRKMSRLRLALGAALLLFAALMGAAPVPPHLLGRVQEPPPRAPMPWDWEEPEPHQPLLALSRTLHSSADAVRRRARALAHARDVDDVMNAFRRAARGGLRVSRDNRNLSIELKVFQLGKKATTKEELARQTEELVRMTRVIRAVAEVLDQYNAEGNAAGVAAWKKPIRGLKTSSGELAEAIRKRSPEAVQAAARNLNGHCTACHALFRVPVPGAVLRIHRP